MRRHKLLERSSPVRQPCQQQKTSRLVNLSELFKHTVLTATIEIDAECKGDHKHRVRAYLLKSPQLNNRQINFLQALRKAMIAFMPPGTTNASSGKYYVCMPRSRINATISGANYWYSNGFSNGLPSSFFEDRDHHKMLRRQSDAVNDPYGAQR